MNIIEQATEFCRDFEISLNLSRKELFSKTMSFIDEEVQETKDAIMVEDREEIIDGFADIAFLAINGIYKEFITAGDTHDYATMKTESVIRRVCEANNSKRQSDGSVLYVDNKVQKPEGWKAPAYADLL